MKKNVLFGMLISVYVCGPAQTNDKNYVLVLTNNINDTTINVSSREYDGKQLKYYEFKSYTDQAKINLSKNVKNIKVCFNGAILEVGALNISGGKQALQTIIDSNWTEFKTLL